ncbi:MAG TPA: vanadium-dependent haloperoxidase [Lacipirellulaceae bacterium]|jgi:hypothetical protein|nr:vanadium-dependent haloperoxidase [Lacipirellulaceae bacterium]
MKLRILVFFLASCLCARFASFANAAEPITIPKPLNKLAPPAGPAVPISQLITKDTGQVRVPDDPGLLIHRQPAPDFKPTAVYRWVEILLEASGRDSDRNKPRPPILSRTMAIVITAMYDAWAAYDDKAVGTRLGGKLRRPAAERTEANKEKAIAYAAYRALLYVYPEQVEWTRERFRKEGFDPDNDSTDPKTPEGVGNAAAHALIKFRRNDGSNQDGSMKGGDGTPYSDYTGYKPKNTADHFTDKTAWCPIPFSDAKGGWYSPGFLHPQCYKVTPFVLESTDQFRPGPPPQYGSEQLEREVEEVMQVNANLTLEQKAVVEFMREGPRSTGQSGHWLQFAQDVSRRDHHDLDQDMKLFFSVANVVFDSFMACWEAKRYYDTGRPYWWVRLYHKGETVEGWLGPGKGFGKVKAEQWYPYSPKIFVTPPFPGYPSGHATASGAASRILELFTGSDHYGAVAFQEAGYMTEPGFTAAQMQARDGKPAEIPNDKVVRLPLPTFTATAEMAAISRLWGGYHIRTDNDVGLVLGRRVAMYSWPKYQAYFDGTAAKPTE